MILSPLMRWVQRTSLVTQIVIGLLVGVALAIVWPAATPSVAFLGNVFIAALKAIAPVLVFVLVMAAISNHRPGEATAIRPVLLLYVAGTVAAALVGVVASTWFPSTLVLQAPATSGTPPGAVSEVLLNVVNNIVANPVRSLMEANYIGILAWAVALGVALRHANATTRAALQDASHAVTQVILWVIRCAPLGILGLVAATFAEAGAQALWGYAHLLAVLLGCMVFVALVVNPLIVFAVLRRNPYPLVLLCLRESGITAFFTRSSAANIPINLALCQRLGLEEETYSVAIPLGATINMAGAAITISVLSLAAAHTLGITVNLPSALLLCIVASVCACGASGVAGGSLLLIPLACSLFGIDNDVAMQVVGVGFIIGVLQDSTETALNSSTDVLFTATACMAQDKG